MESIYLINMNMRSMKKWSLISIMWIVPLSLAIILHEVAHGWMAYKLGDSTAKDLGRLSLNPIESLLQIQILFLTVRVN